MFDEKEYVSEEISRLEKSVSENLVQSDVIHKRIEAFERELEIIHERLERDGAQLHIFRKYMRSQGWL